MTDYTPIDCAQYSEYELAIMHRQRLRICWQEPGGQLHIDVFTPVDLVTREHEEFLVVNGGDEQRLELRLDHIRTTETL
jgi:Rho-binding antiterminator